MGRISEAKNVKKKIDSVILVLLNVKYTTINPQTPNDICIYTSYRTANLQTLHFIYLVNKYTY
jgi:hypothetical protein